MTDLPDASAGPLSLEDMLQTMPFAVQSGVILTAADKEHVTGHVDWAPERCTIGGTLHGGVLMTLADSLGAVAAFLHLPDGAGTATVSSSTVLLRGARSGRVTGTARVVNAGRRFITVQTDLVDDDGKPVSTTTQVQAVLT
jgi:1,4-dihydroxy-2-naphthoyl-CoA hydrolase